MSPGRRVSEIKKEEAAAASLQAHQEENRERGGIIISGFQQNIQGSAEASLGKMGFGNPRTEQEVAHLAGIVPHGGDGRSRLRRRRGMPARH